MKSLLFLVALSLACVVKSDNDDDSAARLLASKNVLNQYVVEGKDLTVFYAIYNVGTSAALDVSLSDKSFPSSDFEIVRGSLDAKWDRINAGANVSHAVILRPLTAGYFNFTSADISYKPHEHTDKPQLGYTSGPGEGAIVSIKDFDRTFSPHVADWAVFALMTLPSLGLPFLLWYSSTSKYSAKTKRN